MADLDGAAVRPALPAMSRPAPLAATERIELIDVVRALPMVDLLAPISRDAWGLVPAGKTARRDLLAADPRLARSSWEGSTPLFTLPDDEAAAVEIVKLFLSYGADASSARQDGTTAEQVARARGLDAAADLLVRR